MRWNEDALYAQFLLRDPADNGKFLTGVVSTGIYCLPSCPARRPKRENVRFFQTPAEAQKTGLRPCRRCRPDFFYRGAEWHENLFEQTAERVRLGPAAFHDLADLARAAGLSRSALADLFREHAHESPGVFLRRIRVNRAAILLAQGTKPADAALAAGFESSSTFHQQFVLRTGLTPGAYAGLGSEFTLRLPAGYRAREVLAFYGRDSMSVSESASDSGIRKCVPTGNGPVLLEIEFVGNTAVCRVDGAPHECHAAIVRML